MFLCPSSTPALYYIFLHANSCTLLPQSSNCRNLLGRGSGYASPLQLPPEAMITDSTLKTGFYVLNYLTQQTQSHPACLELILHMLCLVAKPPCNETTNLPMLLCPQTCLTYEKLISTGGCDNMVAAVIDTLLIGISSEYIWLKDYLIAFNCSDPASYFQNVSTEECGNSSSCTNLFSPETEGIACCIY